jgi:hypothetical protein
MIRTMERNTDKLVGVSTATVYGSSATITLNVIYLPPIVQYVNSSL